jgi:SAM-dependent methyltransferase
LITPSSDGADAEYANRLVAIQQVWWKRLIDVQAPYRWNLRYLKPGFTLDVGCGIGRNLKNLRGLGVGVEPNEHAVQVARSRGFVAYTPDDFYASEYAHPGIFDALLLSHVVEHMSAEVASSLVNNYREFVRPGGQVIFETPQEVGYRSDSTHVRFVDFEAIAELCRGIGAVVERRYSFPFPRPLGRIFVYNEFVVSARLPP